MAFQTVLPLIRRSTAAVPITCPTYRPLCARQPRTSIARACSHGPKVAPEQEVLPQIIVDFANEAANAAGEVIRKHFRTRLDVEFKEDESPVTRADKETEAAIRSVISAAFPNHAILGEESGGESDKEFVWVVDPIDGTKAFITGRPTFATLIALLRDGEPVLGIIDQPITRERWVGIIGVGTTLNGVPVHTHSREVALEQCILQATTPDMFTGLDSVLFRKLARRVKNVVYGGDCYAYATLASGLGDVVVEADLKPWDFLALVPVVMGAGGVMGDWAGYSLGLESEGRVVAAANVDLFTEVTEALGAEEEIGLSPGRTSRSNGKGNGLPEDPGPGHIESMTGYGVGTVEANGFAITTHLRSVNSRYCDVQIKGPKYLSAYDSELVALVKRGVRRGKILLGIDVQSTSAPTGALPVVVDRDAARAVGALLREVRDAAGVGGDVSVGDVISFSEVLVRPDTRVSGAAVLPLVKRAVEAAVGDLCAARRREGALLQEDLLRRTRGIKDTVDEIAERAPDRVEAERRRLGRLTSGVDGVDERRLEAEVTVYADRVDISEEVVRLRAHTQLFEMSVLSDEPVGQKLGFLLQEMNREATTLASKSFDAAITHLAVSVKEELERIREQCLNIR